MPTVYKTSDDTELQAVSRLTAILADLRSGPGDTVAERALIYAAARAGIQLHVYQIDPRPAAPPAAPPTPTHVATSDPALAAPPASRTARRPERPMVARVATSTRGPDYPRPCPYCGQPIGSAGGWSMHVRTRHPDQPRAFPTESARESTPSAVPPAPPAPAPEPLPIEDRPVRYDCPHCGREFVTKASRDGHMGRCLVAHPAAAPEPITLVAGPPDEGSLAYHWRKAWPRPCPECWRVGSVWEAAGPRAMADHRFHHHAIPMDAGHRLHQSLAAAPAAPSKDASGWSCAICRSAAFARYGESDVCVRCHAVAREVPA